MACPPEIIKEERGKRLPCVLYLSPTPTPLTPLMCTQHLEFPEEWKSTAPAAAYRFPPSRPLLSCVHAAPGVP